jgi:hypothetical protein
LQKLLGRIQAARAIEIFTGRAEGQKPDNLGFALPPAVRKLVFSF